jgi:hypothetical protein
LLRWPLSGELSEPDGIAPDVERILTRPNPVLDWPTTCGWADNERRLALRRQAGLLRAFEEMLARGLYGGLVAEDVDATTIDMWLRAVADRRREVADALIEMRLAGALLWWGDRPTWDAFYRQLARFLTALHDVRWNPALPHEGLMMLGANAEDVATVAADVAWMAALTGAPTRQRFQARNWTRLLEIEIWTALEPGEAPAAVAGDAALLSLGLGPNPAGEFAIILSWSNLMSPPATGTASTMAPDRISQALAFSAHEALRGSKRRG